jgi:hypothetical protein
MKLEFLECGSPDCPLIRLYKFNAKEAYDLRRTALQLSGAGKKLSSSMNSRALSRLDGAS